MRGRTRAIVGAGFARACVLAAPLVIACAAPATAVPSPDPTPTRVGAITLTEAGCELAPPAPELRSGRVSFAVFNHMDRRARVFLGQLAQGHTFEEWLAYDQRALAAAEAGAPRLGHPSFVVGAVPLELEAGGSGILTATLSAGTYAIGCLRLYQTLGEIRPYDTPIGPIEVR